MKVGIRVTVCNLCRCVTKGASCEHECDQNSFRFSVELPATVAVDFWPTISDFDGFPRFPANHVSFKRDNVGCKNWCLAFCTVDVLVCFRPKIVSYYSTKGIVVTKCFRNKQLRASACLTCWRRRRELSCTSFVLRKGNVYQPPIVPEIPKKSLLHITSVHKISLDSDSQFGGQFRYSDHTICIDRENGLGDTGGTNRSAISDAGSTAGDSSDVAVGIVVETSTTATNSSTLGGAAEVCWARFGNETCWDCAGEETCGLTNSCGWVKRCWPGTSANHMATVNVLNS